ncbi:radical SAM protein [Planctomycetota bacterium]
MKHGDTNFENYTKLLPDPALFEGLSDEASLAWMQYLYARPKETTVKLNLRNHIISLYDPFASRQTFPAGRRWCVNVYTGCAFHCTYCYTHNYIRNSTQPRIKKGFITRLEKDVIEIKNLGLHPAPIHISNSTDPCQLLEKEYGYTLLVLKTIRDNRSFFSNITFLTKNPTMLCSDEYLEVVRKLPGFHVEVTCPFFNDETRKAFEPHAPSVSSRLRAIEKLRMNNVDVAIRIDPIFPRNPLPEAFFEKRSLADYDAPVSQTQEDLESLITFAHQTGINRLIVSPLKVVVGRFNPSELVPLYRKLFVAANKGKPLLKSLAYRMPWPLYRHWIEYPKAIAQAKGIDLIYCKNNLIETC